MQREHRDSDIFFVVPGTKEKVSQLYFSWTVLSTVWSCPSCTWRLWAQLSDSFFDPSFTLQLDGTQAWRCLMVSTHIVPRLEWLEQLSSRDTPPSFSTRLAWAPLKAEASGKEVTTACSFFIPIIASSSDFHRCTENPNSQWGLLALKYYHWLALC